MSGNPAAKRGCWTPGQGLSTSTIKWIALFFMTLDHIAAFGFEIPIVGRFYNPLRLAGRIAAPLFLFALVQGLRHTSSRPKFLLRLYLAGMGTGLFVAATNLLFGEIVGYSTPGNIIFTFFYVALYSWAVEGVVEGFRKHNWRGAALSLLCCVPDAQPHRQLSAHAEQCGLRRGNDFPRCNALLCQNERAAVRGVRCLLPGVHGRGCGGSVLLSHPGFFLLYNGIFRPVPVPDGAGPALYAALQRTAGEGAEMVLLYLLSRPSICYLCGGDGSAGSVLTPQI